jgi:hypothetical protein
MESNSLVCTLECIWGTLLSLDSKIDVGEKVVVNTLKIFTFMFVHFLVKSLCPGHFKTNKN